MPPHLTGMLLASFYETVLVLLPIAFASCNWLIFVFLHFCCFCHSFAIDHRIVAVSGTSTPCYQHHCTAADMQQTSGWL